MPVAGTSHRAARPWQAVHDLSNRTSLRTKLIIGLLALVIAAVAAISISSVWVLRSYLVSQDDSQLQSVYSSLVTSGQTAGMVPGETYRVAHTNNIWAGVQEPGTPLSLPGSQAGIPYGGYGQGQSVPEVPTSQLWAVANQGKLLTVQAQSGPDTWRVITEPVQLPNSTGSGQVPGTFIVGADLGNINATIGRLAATTLIIGVIIVCVLALAIVMVVRASLRPLVEIEETAEEIAAGHLNRRVPERDPRTEIGSLGRSLNTMLSQIETAFHAQEESEAAAHQSEERMRRFIADASHELRTPLTAIRGFAEYYRQRGGLVQYGDENAEKQPDAIPAETNGQAAPDPEAGLTAEDLDRIMHRVEAEAARMGLLVEDLLLLARLDQQRPLAQRPVDLLSLAADAVHDARLLAPARTIELSVQPGAAFLVIGDEPRLRQVIGNLMSNALTHTPDGTPIQVSVGTGTLDPRKNDSPPAVVLEVTDHGPGMTQEQKRRVFERFYRADQARNRSTGGSGLGLAIVNALVSAQGGTASVRSAPGKGATFRIALPLAPEAQGGHHPDDDADPADLTDELDLTGGTASEAETLGETGEAETAGKAETAGETGADSRAETTAGVPETAREAETAGETRADSRAETTAGVPETAREAESAGDTGADSRAETTAGVPEQWMSQAARDKAGG